MHPGSAERGEAPSGNREHQLMDYLDGRVILVVLLRLKWPKIVNLIFFSFPFQPGGKKDTRSAEALSAGGRTSVSSTSQFRDR